MAQSLGLTIILTVLCFLLALDGHSFISARTMVGLVSAQGIQDTAQVLTTYGTVRGKLQKLQTYLTRTTDVFVFTSIPYAKPPTGDLRFEPPQEPDRWQGVLNTTGRTVLCPQVPSKYAPTTKTEITESEDCLYLNVYTKKIQTNRASPVFVYFHGGDFSYGGKDWYSPDFLLVRDVVVVVANYRLGILGFLSTGDKYAPGNFGLHDQVMVLQWVKMNVDRFGGNPNNVTIFGHDAGAISVSLHLLSERSRGLFSSAISSSGSAFVPGAVRDSLWSQTYNVARRFACSTSSSSDLVKCLRKRTYRELVQAEKSYGHFGPVVEKSSPSPFLKGRPFTLYWNGDYQRVPYLSGVTRDEGTIEYFDRISQARQEIRPEKIIASFLKPRLPLKAPVDVIAIASKFHYNLRFLNSSTFTTSSNNLTELVSDFVYKSANDLAVKLHARGGAKTFMYVFEPAGTTFNSRPSLAYLSNIENVRRQQYGVAHMDDMFYLFRTAYDAQMPVGNENDQASQKIRSNLANILYSFAVEGRPHILQWPTFDQYRLSYLSITENNFVVKRGYRQFDMDFWNEMVLDLVLQAPNPSRNPLSAQVERLENYESATWGMVGVVLVLVILIVALVAVIVANRRKSMHNVKLLSRSFDKDLETRETHL